MDSPSAEALSNSQKKWKECVKAKKCRECEKKGKTFAAVVLWPDLHEPPSKDVYIVDSEDIRDKENPFQTICTSTVRRKD